MLATRPNPIETVTPQLRFVSKSPSFSAGADTSRLALFAANHSALILRLSLALVFCGFGLLKLIPGASPAEHLAGETIASLSLGLLRPSLALPLLGVFETGLGVAVLVKPRGRYTIPMLLIHMAGTLTPFVLFPEQTFSHFPVPTLVGQYILKNVVLVAAALAVLGAPQHR